MILGLQKFKDLTAPGYFNFSGTQTEKTKNIVKWFDSVIQVLVDQANLYDSIFRLWRTNDYTGTTQARTPYVQYQLRNWGLDWFIGSNIQAVGILNLVRIYSESAVFNFIFLFETLKKTPFLWVVDASFPQIVFGTQKPLISAETLIIFSTSVSTPATPGPTVYTERNWAAPAGWTLLPSSATFYSRGYLSAGNIIWMAPQSTSVSKPFFNVANIAGLPVSPVTGSLAAVENDATGDSGAVYYYDGTQWRKTTTPNANQGLYTDTTPPPRGIYAPGGNDPISSETAPPASGPSQGFGQYGGYSASILTSNNIQVRIILTAAGFDNLGIIVNMIRRIKPSINRLQILYEIEGSDDPPVTIEILDTGVVQ